MPKSSKKKITAVICAAVIICLLVAFLSVFIGALRSDDPETSVLWSILILYGVPIIAVIVGVVFALRQRMKEIESGEEEDAEKY